MSVSERTPSTRPSSTTGKPEIRWLSISAAASFSGVSGATVTTGAVMTSRTFIVCLLQLVPTGSPATDLPDIVRSADSRADYY
jgi:hypothetical protein